MSDEGPQRPASLKHELRTPLNHIIGYAEMSIEEAQDRGQDAFIPDLQRIHSAGRRLLTGCGRESGAEGGHNSETGGEQQAASSDHESS